VPRRKDLLFYHDPLFGVEDSQDLELEAQVRGNSTRSSPLRALPFREGLRTLLQEGFEGMDYLSKEEVFELLTEVMTFGWQFFKADSFSSQKPNPTTVSSDVNTNPDFSEDSEFPFGFPVSSSGITVKPRRKRDEPVSRLCLELAGLFALCREGTKPDIPDRIRLSNELDKRLSEQVRRIAQSVSGGLSYTKGVGTWSEATFYEMIHSNTIKKWVKEQPRSDGKSATLSTPQRGDAVQEPRAQGRKKAKKRRRYYPSKKV